jgi:FkbM family methyltransferase
MGLLKTLRFVLEHPLNRAEPLDAVSRYLRWQIGSRVLRAPAVVPFGRRSRLIVERGMVAATGNIYCGLSDFWEMAFTMLLLRPGDLFVDIGANIGTYTVLAAESGADCLSFEPSAPTFNALKANIAVNDVIDRAIARNIALGREPGEILLTTDDGSMNRVVRPEDGHPCVPVPIARLDDECPRAPVLVKIDVEGFESEVLGGGGATLAAARAVLIEINGGGPRLYGFSDEELRDTMRQMGFSTYVFEPRGRSIARLDSPRTDNVLYVRDEAFVRDRLAGAEPAVIRGVAL